MSRWSCSLFCTSNYAQGHVQRLLSGNAASLARDVALGVMISMAVEIKQLIHGMNTACKLDLLIVVVEALYQTNAVDAGKRTQHRWRRRCCKKSFRGAELLESWSKTSLASLPKGQSLPVNIKPGSFKLTLLVVIRW